MDLFSTFNVTETAEFHPVEETTHVFVKTDIVKGRYVCANPDLDYYLAVATGRTIVSYDWARRSVAAERLLPEDRFIVVGDNVRGNHNGQITEPILSDFTVLLALPASEAARSEKAYIRLLRTLGATPVLSNTEIISEHQQGGRCVVLVNNDFGTCSSSYYGYEKFAIDSVFTSVKIPMVKINWIFECVVRKEKQDFGKNLIRKQGRSPLSN